MLTFISFGLVFILFRNDLSQSMNICSKSRRYMIPWTAIEDSVSCCDLIATTQHGLPEDFESFIDLINLHLSSTTLDKLHNLLLTKELSIAHRKKVISSAATEPFKPLMYKLSHHYFLHHIYIRLMHNLCNNFFTITPIVALITINFTIIRAIRTFMITIMEISPTLGSIIAEIKVSLIRLF